MKAKGVNRLTVKAQQDIAVYDSTLAAYDSDPVKGAAGSGHRCSMLLLVDLRQKRVYRPQLNGHVKMDIVSNESRHTRRTAGEQRARCFWATSVPIDCGIMHKADDDDHRHVVQ